MAEDNRKTELLVGLFLLVGLALLGGLILTFSGIRESFRSKYSFSVNFPDASGLVENAPVKLAGAKVGKISATPALNEAFTGVVVPVEIFAGVEIPAGSTFKIGTSGLMGDKLLEIEPPEEILPGESIQPGAVLEGSGESGLGALEDAAQDISRKTARVLIEVEEGLKKLTGAIENLDAGFLGKENAENFNQTLAKLNGAIGKIDSELLGPSNTDNVSESLASLRATMEEFEAVAEEIRTATTKISPVLEKGESAMTELADAAEKLGNVADDASGLIEEMRTGDGLVPALIHDPALKAEFRQLIHNLKERGVLRYKDLSDPPEESKNTGPRLPWTRQR